MTYVIEKANLKSGGKSPVIYLDGVNSCGIEVVWKELDTEGSIYE